MLEAEQVGKLYHISGIRQPGNEVPPSKEYIWHRRYGHLSSKNLKKLSDEELVEEIDLKNFKQLEFCESCIKGKQHRSKFLKSSSRRAKKPLELVHSDVCRKLSEISLGGSQYFVTFIDDYTQYVWVYPLKLKSEVLSKLIELKALVEKSTGHLLKAIRTDNGGEYLSTEFQQFLKSEGVRHERTVPRNPERNGVSERMNRTLIESVRAMLSDSKLPKKFWAEALSTAAYLRNRSPTKSVQGKTPYEALTGEKPRVDHLKVFGCAAYAHVPSQERQKLDEKSRRCIFLGYGKEIKGYRLYDMEKLRVIYSRDVRFDELSLRYKPKLNQEELWK